MREHIQASVRFMPPNGPSGNIPVYREELDQRIGNASYDLEKNIVDIEITDPAMAAWLQKDILTSFSLGSIVIEEKPKD